MSNILLVKSFREGQVNRVRTEVHDMLAGLGRSYGIRWMPTPRGYFLQSPYLESGIIVLTETEVKVTVSLRRLYRPFEAKIRRELEGAMARIGA